MEGETGAVDCFDSFVVCSEFSLGDVAVVCLEEIVRMLVDACVIQMESSKRGECHR